MRIELVENNQGEDGKLTCSECGASGYLNLIRHLKSVHNMVPKDYLEKYPGDIVYTDEMRSKFSKGGYVANQIMQDKGLDFSERSRKARKTEIKNDPEAYLKRNRKLYQDPGFRERAIDRVMKLSKWHCDRYHYNGLSLRSSWEVLVAEWLDSEKIEYQYEGIKVKYFDPIRGNERVYFPDFYLPKYNLVLEVKPKCYLDNLDTQAKKEAIEQEGYKFRFITQDDINDLSVKLLNV